MQAMANVAATGAESNQIKYCTLSIQVGIYVVTVIHHIDQTYFSVNKQDRSAGRMLMQTVCPGWDKQFLDATRAEQALKSRMVLWLIDASLPRVLNKVRCSSSGVYRVQDRVYWLRPDMALTTKLINMTTTGYVRLMLTMAVAQFGR